MLLLISEERDHGSKHTKPVELIQEDRRVGCAGAERIVSLRRWPNWRTTSMDNGGDRTMNMVSALVMAVKAFKKNVAEGVAEESGGEYTTFFSDKRFELARVECGKDARNRYLITFSPSDPTPGLHTIECERPRITARGLWRAQIIGPGRAAANDWWSVPP